MILWIHIQKVYLHHIHSHLDPIPHLNAFPAHGPGADGPNKEGKPQKKMVKSLWRLTDAAIWRNGGMQPQANVTSRNQRKQESMTSLSTMRKKNYISESLILSQ